MHKPIQNLNDLEERYHMNCQSWSFLHICAKVDVPEQKVLGWDVTCCDQNYAYKFFRAEEPLIGMTRPERISRPLGLGYFETWSVSWHQALNNIQQQFGHIEFESITLSKILHSEIENPHWHIHTCCGRDFIVDSVTGKVDAIAQEAAHV